MKKQRDKSDDSPKIAEPDPTDDRSPLQRMIDLSRRVVAVPKTEAEKRKPR
jgi:hypothetical protein